MQRYISSTLFLILAILLGCTTTHQWTRPHNPKDVVFPETGKITNEETKEEFAKTLIQDERNKNTVWYYAGTKEGYHLFVSVDYASPVTYVDEDGSIYDFCGPMIMFLKVPAEELKIEKQFPFTDDYKHWLILKSLSDIGA